MLTFPSEPRWKCVKHERLYERKLDGSLTLCRVGGTRNESPCCRILGCARNAIILFTLWPRVHEYQRPFDLYNVELLFRNRNIGKGPHYSSSNIGANHSREDI